MLSRSELADLNVFLAIARRGSFRAAAIDLSLTTSALSHTMRKLEDRLEVRLLNRTSRSVSLTAAGRELAEALSHGLDAIAEGLNALEAHRGAPVGSLRINAPRDAARLLIAPMVVDFVRRYPQIHIDLIVDDRPIDIVAEGFDAGIRYAGSVPRDMVAVPLTPPLRWIVVGSPEYLGRHTPPRHPDDLYKHMCIQMRVGDNSTYPWELGDGPSMARVDVPGVMRVNETEATIVAAMRGVGLAYCLEMRVREELARGQLLQVMPDWSSMGDPFCMYYPSRRRSPPGLTQLADMVRRQNGIYD
ncbi:LysR family transcriptional regulator [Luteibacter sp. CQ10]|uniref:LysR family transcriptional regulator n=1 Tax=Luteibacter sp. CQ10 TaxID=2805821 RepID=UPI0034A52032